MEARLVCGEEERLVCGMVMWGVRVHHVCA